MAPILQFDWWEYDTNISLIGVNMAPILQFDWWEYGTNITVQLVGIWHQYYSSIGGNMAPILV